MVHQDVEKKCSLLTRFIVKTLGDYPEKVRENLSLYLNTSEKIRLKISRNSLTLTDRTIWHNKLERVPISLIRECKVDQLSPKICYFANETVTNSYQVIVILCKSADDSFKLVNLLQQRVNSQGYYKAHSQWLQRGVFFNDEREKTTPTSKRDSLQSTNVLSHKTKGSSSPQISKLLNSKAIAKAKSATTGQMGRSRCHRIDTSLESAAEDKILAELNGRQEVEDQPIIANAGSEDQSSPSKHEDQVRMRKAVNGRPRAARRRGEAMRSSVIQYESDEEVEEEDNHLQYNLNGIARVTVGGDEEGIKDSQRPANDGYVSLSAEATQGKPDIVAEDIKTVESVVPADKSGQLSALEDKKNVTLDGIYDNIQGLLASVDSTGEELPKEEIETVAANDSSDDGEDEYKLVLTGLQELSLEANKRNSIAPVEQRYPHQIAAAESLITLTHSNPLLSSGKNPELTGETHQVPAVKEPLVPKRCSESKKPQRPHSSIGGLRIIKDDNDLRRSSRRKGQYTSIAEYEKLKCQNQMQNSDSVNVRRGQGDNLDVNGKVRNRNSVCIGMITSASTSNVSTPRSRRSIAVTTEQSNHGPLQPQRITTGKQKAQTSAKENADKDAGFTRRASVVSMISAPNHVVLKRICSKADVASQAAINNSSAGRDCQDRKTHSFDRRNIRNSMFGSFDDNVRQSGLTLVGSRSSLVGHSGRRVSELKEPIIRYVDRRPRTRMSLAEANYDGKPSLLGNNKAKLLKTTLQWTPLPHFKMRPQSTMQCVTVAHCPESSFHGYEQTPYKGVESMAWEQNHSFKRFFDSILAYGPAGINSSIMIEDKPGTFNQPDIVLESLTPDHSPRVDDSDSESSIRSSASAYWPPELKKQSNFCDDFEEAASWQYHSPAVGGRRIIHAS